MGKNKKIFVIAEAGVNHNGKLDLALKLVDVASKTSANAIKFQTFKAEQIVTERGKMASYQKENIGKVMSQRQMLKALELKEEFYISILKRCKQKNIMFLSTPHGGRKSVDFLESIGVQVYKVGSGDLTNYILLERIAETKKPVILSTGMAYMEEVVNAVKFIKSKGAKDISVLHCTTNYPCPPQEVNLAAMVTMKNALEKRFGVKIGYSDHTVGKEAAIMAASLGALVYECHFTLDKNLPGPDHKASADPKELKERIDAIRKVEVMMGESKKQPTKSEMQSMRKAVRKSIVASKDLPQGHIFQKEDLEAKRPGDGLSPVEYEKFIGKTLKGSKKKDEQLFLTDI